MTRFITKFASVCLLVLGIASTSYAQDNDIIRPITSQGSAAFIFTLNGLGDFGLSGPVIGASSIPRDGEVDESTSSTEGGSTIIPGFGMKYFVSENTALRLGLAFRMFEDGKEDLDQTAMGGPRGKEQRNTTGINFGGEYHFRPLYSTTPYIGALISFVTDNHKVVYNPAGGTNTTFNHKSTSFGVAAVGGINWFFTRGIAIGAEYGVGFTSTSTVFENTAAGITKQDEPTNTDVGLGVAGAGSVQVVIYF